MNKKKIAAVCAVLAGLLPLQARAEMSQELANESLPTDASVTVDGANEESPNCLSVPNCLQSGNGAIDDLLKGLDQRIKLHGYAQGGYFYNNKDGENVNSFEIKRVLFWANAQITDRWSFLFMHDFSSVVQEYYTDYRVTNNNALTVRLGQFKNCCTFENPLSPTSMETIDVYSEGVTYLTGCGSDPLFGVQYGRDLGMSLYGETNDKFLRYELQLMNGQGINRKDRNNQKDIIGRLEMRPAKGLNIVATGQLGRGNAVAASVYNPEIQIGQNYERNRYSVGFDYKSKPFNMHGEYLEGKDGKAISRGAYMTGSVNLAPNLDFVASYDFFNFNKSLHMDQHKAVGGFQYWFYDKCRFQVQYIYKSAWVAGGEFHHGANHGIMCQMQVRFN